jgi:SiaC family regulatory phosphoprotein
MEPLQIAATEESPGINFDKQNGKFLLFGKSFPEEVKKFYNPVIYWLEEYVKDPNEESIFEFRFEYFNSATSTILLEIFYILERIIANENKKVKVIWNYLEVDDDMLETGREYEEMIKIPFEYIIIEDY